MSISSDLRRVEICSERIDNELTPRHTRGRREVGLGDVSDSALQLQSATTNIAT